MKVYQSIITIRKNNFKDIETKAAVFSTHAKAFEYCESELEKFKNQYGIQSEKHGTCCTSGTNPLFYLFDGASDIEFSGTVEVADVDIAEPRTMLAKEDGHKAITFEDIEKALNEVGFGIVEFDTKYAEQWTETADEDWILNLYGDTPEVMAKNLIEKYEKFDIDEDVELFIPGRGKNGVPSSVRVLVENAEEKDKKLGRLSEILRSMLLK